MRIPLVVELQSCSASMFMNKASLISEVSSVIPSGDQSPKTPSISQKTEHPTRLHIDLVIPISAAVNHSPHPKSSLIESRGSSLAVKWLTNPPSRLPIPTARDPSSDVDDQLSHASNVVCAKSSVIVRDPVGPAQESSRQHVLIGLSEQGSVHETTDHLKNYLYLEATSRIKTMGHYFVLPLILQRRPMSLI